MCKDHELWLKHLIGVIPEEGYGNKLSMYLIALEAWRRGIKVNFFTIDNPENKLLIRYSLEYGGRTYRFESSRGDKLSQEAYEICEDKHLTKKYLENAGLKVPKGKRFNADEDPRVIASFAETLSYPVVVKPVDGNAGKGVFSNIDSPQKLFEVVSHLKNDLGYKDLLLEEYIPGVEYRVLTVEGKVYGAVNRVPANVTGNGKDTIRDLIKTKNQNRKSNPVLSKKAIKIDREVIDLVNHSGYDLESVLEKDMQLFLRTKSNVSTGGDPVDVTDDLPEKIIHAAEKAAKSIPGLNIAGMDIIVNPESQEPTFIEINTKPMIGLHVFPIQGMPRDVVKPIIDSYFPETRNIERSNLYFDFESVLAPLDNKSVKRVEVEPPETLGELHARKFEIRTEGKESGYASYIRLEALKREIHGYVKKIRKGSYEVLAAAENEQVLEIFKERFHTFDDNLKILEIKEAPWTKSVNIGFIIKRVSPKELKIKIEKEKLNIIKNEKKIRKLKKKLSKLYRNEKELEFKNKSLRAENKKLENEKCKLKRQNRQARLKISELEKENKQIKKSYNDIINSRSWRLTKPLRKYNILNLIKKNIGEK